MKKIRVSILLTSKASYQWNKVYSKNITEIIKDSIEMGLTDYSLTIDKLKIKELEV